MSVEQVQSKKLSVQQEFPLLDHLRAQMKPFWRALYKNIYRSDSGIVEVVVGGKSASGKTRLIQELTAKLAHDFKLSDYDLEFYHVSTGEALALAESKGYIFHPPGQRDFQDYYNMTMHLKAVRAIGLDYLKTQIMRERLMGINTRKIIIWEFVLLTEILDKSGEPLGIPRGMAVAHSALTDGGLCLIIDASPELVNQELKKREELMRASSIEEAEKILSRSGDRNRWLSLEDLQNYYRRTGNTSVRQQQDFEQARLICELIDKGELPYPNIPNFDLRNPDMLNLFPKYRDDYVRRFFLPLWASRIFPNQDLIRERFYYVYNTKFRHRIAFPEYPGVKILKLIEEVKKLISEEAIRSNALASREQLGFIGHTGLQSYRSFQLTA